MPNASDRAPKIAAVYADGYPFDRPAQIRPGVRYAEADAPWAGKHSVPAPGDKSARHGEIEDYSKMGGNVTARRVMKGAK
jgi:hypothetical protein